MRALLRPVFVVSLVVGATALSSVAPGGHAAASPPVKLLFSPTSFTVPPLPPGLDDPPLVVTVTNSGVDALVMNGTVQSIGGFVASSDCPGVTLAPGDSCHMSYSYQPLPGATTNVTSTGSWNGQSYSIDLNGSATPNGLLISPTGLDFGAWPTNTESSSRRVTVTNLDRHPVTLSGAPTLGGSNPSQFKVVESDCGGRTLAQSETCHMDFAFVRLLTTGARNATATGTWNGQAYSIALTGGGSLAHGLVFSSTAFDFGTAYYSTPPAAQLSTITNNGTNTITISGITNVPGPYTPNNVGGGCVGAVLTPFDSCDLNVTLATPNGGTISAAAGFWLTGTDSGTGPFTTTYSFNFHTVQVLPVTPLARRFNFGEVPKGSPSPALSVPFTNLSPYAQDAVEFNFNSVAPFTKTADCVGQVIPGHGDCSMQWVFSPTAAGPQSAGVSGSVIAAGAISIALAGIGVATPGAPVALAVAPEGGALHVTWQPPRADGGSPVTGYTATSLPAGINQSVAATSPLSLTIPVASAVPYRFIVSAQNANGSGPGSTTRAATVFGEYVPVQPERLLDTRFGTGYVGAKPVAGDIVQLQVTGVGATQVPGDAVAVALNVTGTGATNDGFVTVWPCGQPQPLASNLNLAKGATAPNLVIVKLGDGGKVCLFTQSGTDLVADINGWFPATTSFHPVQPERLLDTRDPPTGFFGGKPTAGQVVALQVTGAGATNVPSDASAVVLNVTGVGATADGFVTVWPCGQTQPTASNLNLTAGAIEPNLVIAKIGVNGKVCLFTQSRADLVADIDGWFPALTGFHPVLPERLLETRPVQVGYSGPKPPAGAVVQLQVTAVGASQVPADASAVVLNVTGTGASRDGFVTVWPCGQTQPKASNLNLLTGGTAPNLVIVKLGDGGNVCLFTQSGTDLVADVNGWFPD
jgi:hypothetical protein